VWLWLAVSNYNQQTSKNNLKQKFTLKSKPHRKNPIDKATTTIKLQYRKENEDLTAFLLSSISKDFEIWLQM
jgi:hypothetical protein